MVDVEAKLRPSMAFVFVFLLGFEGLSLVLSYISEWPASVKEK